VNSPLKIISMALFSSFMFITVSPLAQASNNHPCAAPEAAQFNFWLGEWELTWPAEQWGGKPDELGRGVNHIRKILGECIIEENFQFPKQNFNGRSLSAYNAKKAVWQQTWVDNQGGYLLFTGKFEDNKMELRTEPFERKGKTLISRMVFKNITDQSFDWDWQRSDNLGESWKDLWNIHYERKQLDMK